MIGPDYESLKKIQVQMTNRKKHENEEIVLRRTKNQEQENQEKILQVKMKEKCD